MSPSDERTRADYVSRKQLRTVYLQGFVALIDGRRVGSEHGEDCEALLDPRVMVAQHLNQAGL